VGALTILTKVLTATVVLPTNIHEMRGIHVSATAALLLHAASNQCGVAADIDPACPLIPVAHLRNLESCLNDGEDDAFACMRLLDECDNQADPLVGLIRLQECSSTYSEYVTSIGAGSCTADADTCSSPVADLVDLGCTDFTICPTNNSTEAFDSAVKCYRLGLATLEEQAS
jgi:hypothetical protein